MSPKLLHDTLIEIRDAWRSGDCDRSEKAQRRLDHLIQATAKRDGGKVGTAELQLELPADLYVDYYCRGHDGSPWGDWPEAPSGPDWDGDIYLNGWPVIADIDPFVDEGEANAAAIDAAERDGAA